MRRRKFIALVGGAAVGPQSLLLRADEVIQ
jgi:hypothetical protein